MGCAVNKQGCPKLDIGENQLSHLMEIPVDHAEVGLDGKTADEVIMAGNTEASGTECRAEVGGSIPRLGGGVVLDLKNDNGHVEECPSILRVVNEAGWRLSLYKQAVPDQVETIYVYINTKKL